MAASAGFAASAALAASASALAASAARVAWASAMAARSAAIVSRSALSPTLRRTRTKVPCGGTVSASAPLRRSATNWSKLSAVCPPT